MALQQQEMGCETGVVCHKCPQVAVQEAPRVAQLRQHLLLSLQRQGLQHHQQQELVQDQVPPQMKCLRQ